ncbi:acyl-CoA dehydrogenase family protein [Streptomyces sp. NPDC054796]
MDFTPSEEQCAARDLAADIFAGLSTPERLASLGTATDAELWKALCAAGLPEAVEETGLLGLALMLEEQGRTTAQVPFAASCAFGLLPVARHGSDAQRARLLPALRAGAAVVAGAFPRGASGGVRAGADGTLTGVVPLVPWLQDATHVLVPAAAEGGGTGLYLLDADDLGDAGAVEPVDTTAPWRAGRLTLADSPAEPLGPRGPDVPPPPHSGPYADTLALARTAFAALQAGVCAGSLARAVAYVSEREQFGRPLATKQAVQLRAADAYMDVEAIRLTTYEAAWRRDEGLTAQTHALTAAWWAAEAGRRVVHTGQHLHGGVGADVEHPVHRHFLWGRQLDAYLGSPPELLAELGRSIASETVTEDM